MADKDLFSGKRVETGYPEDGAGMAGDDKHEIVDEELNGVAGGIDVVIPDQLKPPGRYRVKGEIKN